VKRIFNTAGPCNRQDHYIIDPLRRLGAEIMELIDQKAYFVIHSARQTGKTTLLKELTRQVNAAGKYHAVYCTLETAQTAATAEVGIPIIINAIYWAVKNYNLPNARLIKDNTDTDDIYNTLQMTLSAYCRSLDKPLVIFFDEADCLSVETLIPFLRQLRSGYVNRPEFPFIHSLALTGMRNIRDYRDEYRLPEKTLGSSSPFNIITESMTLRNFSQCEIGELYQQHADDTGQEFSKDAIELVWEQTQGQPWLVNAIAYEAVRKKSEDEAAETITADKVTSVIQTLILKRDTHFDSLIARLHEDRVRRVIEPIIIGKEAATYRYSDDYSYVKDMGLIRDDRGIVEPANPIYTEIIIRSLNWDTQVEIEQTGTLYQMPRYLQNGTIDMDCLLSDFQVFWRENSDIWRKKYDYQEAAPQLILQAFLQRILNGGGQIVRELAAAASRVDLCIIYHNKKYPVEMKIRYNDEVYSEGAEQIVRYMDILGCDRGWLVVFDQRVTLSWSERIFCRKTVSNGKTIMIFGY